MDSIATKPATPFPHSSGLGRLCWRRSRIVGVFVLAALTWSVFCHGRPTSSAHAAYAAVAQRGDLDELPRRSEFSAFLRQQAPPELWVHDVLGRWRRSKQPARQFAYGLELSLWLERELAGQAAEELRAQYPELASDTADLGDTYAAIQLVWLRLAAATHAQTAFDHGLRSPGPDRAAEIARLRDLQRELRAVLDRFDRLANALEANVLAPDPLVPRPAMERVPDLDGAPRPEGTLDEERSLAERQLQQRQVQQLRDLATGTMAWLFYYEWLLEPNSEQVDLERVRQAQQMFMRLLGITATDLQTTDLFRWYDPTSPSAPDHLLGLGLCSAALAQPGPATTCFATLQQSADKSQGQRVLLWQIHNNIKRNRWDDALLLSSTYLQPARKIDDRLATQTVETVLRWFSDASDLPPSPAASVATPAKTVNAPAPSLPAESRISVGGPTGPALVWQWRVLESLVQRGQVETVAGLVKRYGVRPGPGLYGQVLALHQLLAREPLERLSREQLQQVAERLEPWTASEPSASVEPPVPANAVDARPTRGMALWAKQWLARVHTALGDFDAAQRLLTTLHEETPADRLEQRQQLAWQVATDYERRAATDWAARQACLQWFQQAASVAELPLSAAAEVKVRLWELADQPLAQLAYLQAVPPNSAAYAFAQRQQLQWLYERYLDTVPNTAARQILADRLQTLLLEQVGVRPPPRVAAVDSATPTAWQTWQAELAEHLVDWESTGQVPHTAALLTLWLQLLEHRNDPPSLDLRQSLYVVACHRALVAPGLQADQWQPLLVSAVLFWSRPDRQQVETDLRDRVVERLVTEPLPTQQQWVLLNAHVPIRRREWDATWAVDNWVDSGPTEVQQAADTRQLLRLYQQGWGLAAKADVPVFGTDEEATSPSAEVVALRRWQCDYAEFLWRIGSSELARQVLESRPITDLRGRQVKARVLSSLAPRTATERVDTELVESELVESELVNPELADTLWRQVLEQVPPGSLAWFEARYYRLKFQSVTDPRAAAMAYNQLRQLYPAIPAPWSTALEQLAVEHGW